MKPNKHYVVIKPIPLSGGGSIPLNASVYRTQGVYYLEGGLLPQEYQEDFDRLIEHEEIHGWKYVSPIKDKVVFQNPKENLV